MNRRQALFMGATFASWAFAPRIVSAAGAPDRRLLFVNLQGALDGLAAVAPVGDPNYELAREGLVLEKDGSRPGLKIDSFFVLNPNMPSLGKLIQSGEALVCHATATAYRARSHFDGQDVLESGQPVPGFTDTGWLNRLIGLLPAGEPVRSSKALALGSSVPLVLRGPQPVLSWMPAGFPEVSSDTRTRILDLYNHTDPDLARIMSEALKLEAATGNEAAMAAALKASMAADVKGAVKQFAEVATAAGKLLAKPDGPRVAALTYQGWDTHQGQGPVDGRLGKLLAALDAALGALHKELEPVWKDTVVVVATEFGRTVRINGTAGTDHGTATVAFLLGGAVKGGRVLTDWPGLSTAALYEGRDLKPTTDLRSVLKGVLADHWQVSERALAETVFPESQTIKPYSGLVA